jgi:ABC-type multidrug transport system fused ATPase/permease subunit
MYSIAEENLRLMPAIKSFNRESLEQAHFEQANRELLELSRRQMKLQSALSPATSLLGSAALATVIAISATQIEAGGLTAADLVTVLLYTMLMLSPLGILADTYGRVQTVRGAMERMNRFLNAEPESDNARGRKLGPIRGAIRIENLAFSYPGRAAVFSDFNLVISAGETIGLTGCNGAGKSTLAHLLMGFERPARGRILLDGIDTAEVDLSSLRANVGLVAQRVLLVNGTVADNIAYGCPGVSREQLEHAARLACAHEFIEALPLGYDTVIGDEGVRLSGGQRQRLSLARTLVPDPPILILDEATAMFDPEGEQEFLGDCRAVLEGKTTILITHRPASLALADRIVSIEGGRAIERPRDNLFPRNAARKL